MPFRFHKSRKVLPGVRMNFSKSGIGASIGPKGLRMSIGPKGIRTTQSIPGTGISFIQQHGRSQKSKKTGNMSSSQISAKIPIPPGSSVYKESSVPQDSSIPPNSSIPPVINNNLETPNPKRKKIILIILAAIVGLFILCMVFGLISSSSPSGKATSTARSMTRTAESIPTKTPFSTDTPIPTETPQPAAPTQTEAIVVVQETPTQNPFCECQKDYNCSDFSSHQQAQECFNSCGGSSIINWSNLDGTDSDGIVCESLP